MQLRHLHAAPLRATTRTRYQFRTSQTDRTLLPATITTVQWWYASMRHIERHTTPLSGLTILRYTQSLEIEHSLFFHSRKL